MICYRGLFGVGIPLVVGLRCMFLLGDFRRTLRFLLWCCNSLVLRLRLGLGFLLLVLVFGGLEIYLIFLYLLLED